MIRDEVKKDDRKSGCNEDLYSLTVAIMRLTRVTETFTNSEQRMMTLTVRLLAEVNACSLELFHTTDVAIFAPFMSGE